MAHKAKSVKKRKKNLSPLAAYAWDLDRMVRKGRITEADARDNYHRVETVSRLLAGKITFSQALKMLGIPAKTAIAPPPVWKSAGSSLLVKSSRNMVERQLERTYLTSDNPADREAAYKALRDIRAGRRF